MTAGVSLYPETWTDIHRTMMEHSTRVPEDAPPEVRNAEKHSQKRWFIEKMVSAAISQAKEKGLKPDNPDTLDFIWKAQDAALDITFSFGGMTYAYDRMTEDEARSYFRMTSPISARHVLQDIQRLGPLKVNGGQLEAGVAGYLRGEVRDPAVDWLLLRSLTQMEITQFLDEQTRANPLTKRSVMQDKQISPGDRWFRNRGKALLLTLALMAASVVSAVYVPWIPQFLGVAAAALFAICFIGYTAFSGLVVFINRKELGQPRAEWWKLMEEMIGFFAEFHDPEVVSIPHFRRRVEELRAMGAVWPQALWVMLDDLEARGVRRL